jgi:predicted acetyltransferase
LDARNTQAPARVRELVATTPAAHARLWAFLLDQDLTRTITWGLARVDEPLARAD